MTSQTSRLSNDDSKILQRSKEPEQKTRETIFASDNFWSEIYDDIERLIVGFFCLDDLIALFVVSKNYNKAISKWVDNVKDYNYNFDSVAILPGVRHGLDTILQNFAISNKKKEEQEAQEAQKENEHCKIVKENMDLVKLLLSKSVSISKWFMNYLIIDKTCLIDNLLSMKNETARKEYSNLIIIALKSLQSCEKDTILQTNLSFKNRNNDDTNIELKSISLRFINVLIGLIDEILIDELHWKKMESFWNIFEKIIMFGNEYTHYFINKDFISLLSELYLGNELSSTKQYNLLGNDAIQPKFTPVIYLISILVRSCHSPKSLSNYKKGIQRLKLKNINSDDKYKKIEQLLQVPPASITHSQSIDKYSFSTLFELSNQDHKLLHRRVFYTRLVRGCWQNERVNQRWLNYVNNIFHHWCFGDKLFSFDVIKLLIEGIDRSDLNNVEMYLLMVQELITIKQDNLFQHRFNSLFNCDNNVAGKERMNMENLEHRMQGNRDPKYGKTLDIIDLIEYYRDEHRNFGYKLISGIFEWMRKDEQYAKLMLEIRDNRWKQWDQFVYEFCNPNPHYHYMANEVRNRRKTFWNKYVDFFKANNVVVILLRDNINFE